jgi:hypothetical protein
MARLGLGSGGLQLGGERAYVTGAPTFSTCSFRDTSSVQDVLPHGVTMTLDQSFGVAKSLCGDIQGRIDQIETEQDARVQIISRFLTEVLGWDFADIKAVSLSG